MGELSHPPPPTWIEQEKAALDDFYLESEGNIILWEASNVGSGNGVLQHSTSVRRTAKIHTHARARMHMVILYKQSYLIFLDFYGIMSP